MDTKYRCLTCYEQLTKDEYCEHKRKGHVTVEYIEYSEDKKEEE